MFIVKKVRFKNFRSYGNQFTEIDLVRSASTVITAPNGSGKSSILMAVEFGLFGRVSNGINKNDLVNTINRKDCVVEVECETQGKQILVRRGIKPAIFDIIIDGKLVDQESTTRDYQSKFEDEILGFNIQSFRQVVSISGSNYTPFLLLSAGNRRKIVEELLNLTVFTRMNQLHNINQSETRESVQQIESKISTTDASIKSLKKGLDNLAQQEDIYRKTIEDDIALSQTKIAELESKINEASQSLESLSSWQERHSVMGSKKKQLRDYGRDLTAKAKRLSDQIKFFKENDVCPVCTQGLSQDFKDASIHQHQCDHEKITKALEDLKSLALKNQEKLAKVEAKLEEMKAIQTTVNMDQSTITTLQKHIAKQQKLLSAQGNNGESLREEIRKGSEQLLTLKEERLRLLEEKQYLDLIGAIIKDNGIKATIIKQYVPAMNREINRYLDILNLDMNFEMDESFQERIYSRFKDELSYSSFSAGERARIDIAILFTWRELSKLKNSLSCNLLFLDEIFDSVLDGEGLESFINLLRYHLKGTNVFMVSHRPEVVDKLHSNLRITKQGNFSMIEV